MHGNRSITAAFVSLGCDKNRVDTEELMGLLKKERFIITGNLSRAEVIIVNTCSFIVDARSEAIDTLLELSRFKKNGSCKLLVAAGCMAQMYHKELLKELPEADLVVGMSSYPRLPRLIRLSLKKALRISARGSHPEKFVSYGERTVSSAPHHAFIKIAEGCSNRCSYCLIPGIRGGYRSRPLENILTEAEGLVSKGAREITLIAQDTTLYGKPESGKHRLPELLAQLNRVEGLQWIRLLYAHPSRVDDHLLDTITGCSKVCPYLDLPLQHINSGILRKMGRGYTKSYIRKLYKKIKAAGITIRTTFMVGFPGEEEKHFQELLDFIKSYPLDRMGAFIYSPEKGTPAYKYPRRIPAPVKRRRFNTLMETQREISYNLNRREVGRVYPVIIEKREGKEKKQEHCYKGRTPLQAPEVDGCVYICSPHHHRVGEAIKVKITACDHYDLYGEPV